ncbi:nucleoside hydrolase [Nocardia takedensis]|uniref:nucleoside hydrolase n=1 Tax=Nocardia takedensis TaxID=259390 RepID=UPI0002F35E99|nr:nucleoside hydrolase [Nocardia takedensis]
MPDQPLSSDLWTVQPAPATGLVILSTDIGYDPDDLFALTAAARTVDNLVVVTSDEVGGLRAELARRMLDLLGREDVEVLRGVDLGGKRRFLPDPGQDIPDYIRPTPEEQLEAGGASISRLVDLVFDSTHHPVHWVGCGPMTELAHLLASAPDAAEQILVTQMGGWLDDYRSPDRAEHNLRTNSLAAGVALRMLPSPRLVLADHTNNPAIRVTPDWDLIRALDSDHAPEWARLIGTHFHRWLALGYDGSWMHDPLTFTAALAYPFIDFTETRVRIEDDARLYRDPYGRTMRVSETVRYPAFAEWLHEVISW